MTPNVEKAIVAVSAAIRYVLEKGLGGSISSFIIEEAARAAITAMPKAEMRPKPKRPVWSAEFVGIAESPREHKTRLLFDADNHRMKEILNAIGNPTAKWGEENFVGLRKIFNEFAWNEVEQEEAAKAEVKQDERVGRYYRNRDRIYQCMGESGDDCGIFVRTGCANNFISFYFSDLTEVHRVPKTTYEWEPVSS